MGEVGRVKICGLCRREDVLRADEAGADYLGAVLSGGFSRSVDPDAAAELMAGASATPVAVLVDEEPEVAAALATTLGAGVVQLHGRESPEVAAAVGAAGTWRVWKAVRARSAADVVEAAKRYAGVVDGLLVEGWKEGVVGGGGARLDTSLARAVRDAVPGAVELVLAGGLDADNVFDAVARFAPDVVDVSSGVERALCQKDEEKVRRFVSEARRAWNHPPPSHDERPGAPS